MKSRTGGVVASGVLCAIAATVALWSGPLAAASHALHTDGTVQVSVTTGVHHSQGSSGSSGSSQARAAP